MLTTHNRAGLIIFVNRVNVAIAESYIEIAANFDRLVANESTVGGGNAVSPIMD